MVREDIHVDEAVLKAGDHHGSTYYQHMHFRDMVLAGRNDPQVSVADGLWSVLIGEAAEESANTGQAISL